MSVREQFTGETVLNGVPVTMAIMVNPTIDDVIIVNTKIAAFQLANPSSTLKANQTPYSLKDFLVRLRIQR